ncbi:UPF0426 protein At1g28150, chloroplastic [Lotus japonicus]|uniref:UPF0426 protein At1g28150, chloroplastic n=1 Tax=Lotus japonicus TaxID=34305 RepID=UPI002582C86D|nr:UPF0426 protein At1g28150, chloroplastic [Lotus japonicus]
MSLLCHSLLPLPCSQWKLKHEARLSSSSSLRGRRIGGRSRSMAFNSNSNSHGTGNGVTAFFFNPAQDPIVQEALKEPVAFLGGMFAGILRLDLNEEPLKEWVTRTVEAAGVDEEETTTEGSTTEAAPQEIVIE